MQTASSPSFISTLCSARAFIMFSIITAVIIFFTASIGYGCLWRQVCTTEQTESHFHELALIGVALLAFGATFLSCLLPLSGFSGISFLALGVALGTRELFKLFRCYGSTTFGGAALLLIALLAYLSWPLASHNNLEAYDTALYHLQQVQWLRLHGTPLGLANLHIRLGVQSSYLTLAALMEQGILADRSSWFMPLVVPILGLWWCITTIIRSFRTSDCHLIIAYCVVVSAFILPQVLLPSPSLYHDGSAGIIQIILVGEVLRLFGSKKMPLSQIQWSKSIILILAVFSVTIKLSSAASATLSVLFLALYRVRILPSIISFALVSIAMMSFLVRNILLTGWLLFPAPIGQLPVMWAVPRGESGMRIHDEAIQTVVGHYEIVRAWARLPGPDYHQAITAGLTAWWPSWIARFSQSGEAKLLLYSYAALLLGLCLIRSRRDVLEFCFVLLLGSIPIVYWFSSAPDVRFGGASFWILWALSFAYTLKHISVSDKSLCALGCVWMVWNSWPAFARTGRPVIILTAKAESAPTATKISSSGTAIQIPGTPGDDRCGNAPVPCTPYFRADLIVEKDGPRYSQIRIVPEKS